MITKKDLEKTHKSIKPIDVAQDMLDNPDKHSPDAVWIAFNYLNSMYLHQLKDQKEQLNKIIQSN